MDLSECARTFLPVAKYDDGIVWPVEIVDYDGSITARHTADTIGFVTTAEEDVDLMGRDDEPALLAKKLGGFLELRKVQVGDTRHLTCDVALSFSHNTECSTHAVRAQVFSAGRWRVY
jgi:hypothetical protein